MLSQHWGGPSPEAERQMPHSEMHQKEPELLHSLRTFPSLWAGWRSRQEPAGSCIPQNSSLCQGKTGHSPPLHGAPAAPEIFLGPAQLRSLSLWKFWLFSPPEAAGAGQDSLCWNIWSRQGTAHPWKGDGRRRVAFDKARLCLHKSLCWVLLFCF